MTNMPKEFINLVEQVAQVCDNSYRRGFYQGYLSGRANKGEECDVIEWMLRHNEPEGIAIPPPVPNLSVHSTTSIVDKLHHFSLSNWTELNRLLQQYIEERDEQK